MINLKEALKITKIAEDEVIYIRKEGFSKYDVDIVTLKEVRNKYDMKNTMVTSIQPRFDSDGEYCGMELEIM